MALAPEPTRKAWALAAAALADFPGSLSVDIFKEKRPFQVESRKKGLTLRGWIKHREVW